MVSDGVLVKYEKNSNLTECHIHLCAKSNPQLAFNAKVGLCLCKPILENKFIIYESDAPKCDEKSP